MATRSTAPARCTTCGSDIDDTVNGSNFGDGECGPCEERRYRSQREFLAVCRELSRDDDLEANLTQVYGEGRAAFLCGILRSAILSTYDHDA
jgi:predicted RNA-binding Zn-ribbon protein involved in translation (DUF1610 family)